MGLRRMIPKRKLERMLMLARKLKAYQAEYNELRDWVLDSFDSPPEVKEVFELYGIEVMRYPSGINTPILDERRAFQLLDEKQLRAEATYQVEVISREKLDLLLREGKLTLEEYNSMFHYKVTPHLKLTDKREVHSAELEETESEVG